MFALTSTVEAKHIKAPLWLYILTLYDLQGENFYSLELDDYIFYSLHCRWKVNLSLGTKWRRKGPHTVHLIFV